MFRGLLLSLVLMHAQLCISAQEARWSNAECEQIESLILQHEGKLDQGMPVPCQIRKHGTVHYVPVRRPSFFLEDGRDVPAACTGYVDVTGKHSDARRYDIRDGFLEKGRPVIDVASLNARIAAKQARRKR